MLKVNRAPVQQPPSGTLFYIIVNDQYGRSECLPESKVKTILDPSILTPDAELII